MARRGWDSLSDAYRARLTRGGISRQAYESGVPLRSARGHSATPERPGQGLNNPAFRNYYTNRPTSSIPRRNLQNAVKQRVRDIFSDRHKFRGTRDWNNPPTPTSQVPPTPEILAMLQMDDSDIEDLAGTDTWWILWYHESH